jgi:hypothetical protein
MLPPAWLATLEYYFRPSVREPSGGPLNGQYVRQQIVLQLLRAVPFEAIVETGTYRGSSTEFFATQSRVPVHTVESFPRFFYYSKLRFRRRPHVRVACGDSREFLRRLDKDPTFPKHLVFFYLDAHWYEELPLREEVELITGSWKDAAIMIDDFEVPGDTGYGFDNYGPDKRLCLEYLPPLSSLGMTAYFPAVPSTKETGPRRGCVVLADPALADRIASVHLLRPHYRDTVGQSSQH